MAAGRHIVETARATMRLILSRKGFDSSSGGGPSPIFPDGSMIALPIPDRRSPVRYCDLVWRGRNLGEIVAQLTRGRRRGEHGAHLDPDLRREMRPREPGWRGTLGQLGAAQGHLRKQGVGLGDLFLFWGAFRRVDESLRWSGPTRHYVWGWLQVGAVAPVDALVRTGNRDWRWALPHPHLAFQPDATNTLYAASDHVTLGVGSLRLPGAGVFDFAHDGRRLTAEGASKPSEWSLPAGFLPRGRPALSYHGSAERWSTSGAQVRLLTVGRGQEFVLDLDSYPELTDWLFGILGRAAK